MTTAREMIERTDFLRLLKEPRSNALKYYLLDTCAFNDLTELRGAEFPWTVRLDKL